ncbi:MAG: hypothetical protein ACFFG0_16535, partial [Candidatus Thorarchaeota archaeon]
EVSDSYYSQLIEYDFNLEIKNIIVDLILGKISVIEYDEIDSVESLILGIERLAIGKMDVVIALRRKTGTEEWVDFQISGFDELKFRVLDLLAIHENNIRKLIVCSSKGLYETKISFAGDLTTITSPICFTTVVYKKQDLQPDYYPVVIPEKTPINMVNKITYKLNGDNNWYDLTEDQYRASRTEVRLDLNSIWSNLAFVKLAYSFESFVAEQKTSIDPSFKKESSRSDTQELSAWSIFYSDISLPLLWLNPATSYESPLVNWNSLPNSLTYQYTPVISGLGSTAVYPEVKSEWSSDYMIPELENSLIYYGDSYNSGILSQNLNAKDDYLGETIFDGNYEGNYIDGVWISNPFISENYNFSQMYYTEIQKVNSENGPYKKYVGEQKVLVQNRLTDIDPYNSSISRIYDSGVLPSAINPEYLDDITFAGSPFSGGSMSGAISDTNINDPNHVTLLPGGSGDIFYIEILNFKLADPDSYNGDDFYLSLYLEMETGGTGELKINGQESLRGSIINIDRQLIQDVNNIGFRSWGAYDAYLYYFKVERVSSSNPAVQGASLAEMETVSRNWSQYMTTTKEDTGDFGFEFIYKLPVVSKTSLESILISFDASIVSTSFAQEYPLSLQLWNFEFNRWESLPLAPLSNGKYYTDGLDLDFWAWNPTITYIDDDMFRPIWSTTNLNNTNTISYGDTLPYTIDGYGNIVFDNTVFSGASFLKDDDTGHEVHNLYTDQDYKVLFYDSDYNTKKYQLSSIIINPDAFYTRINDNFPAYQNNIQFSPSSAFYNNFLNDKLEFKVRLISKRESDQLADAHLCLGTFNAYTFTDTNYLNYDEFDSNAVGTHKISDDIDFNSDGINLYGYSGFNLKEPERTEKFRDNFESTTWTLLGTEEDTIFFEKNIKDATIVRSLHPNTVYNTDTFSTYRHTTPTYHKSRGDLITSGNLISGSIDSTWTDGGSSMVVESEYRAPFDEETKIRFEGPYTNAKTFDLYYDIYTDFPTTISISLGDSNSPLLEIVSEISTFSLTGWCRVEDNDPALEYIWVETYSWLNHLVNVDWLVSFDVVEEIETFVVTEGLTEYLPYGISDFWELEATSTDGYGTLVVYSTSDFSTDLLTWNNRPYTYTPLSSTYVTFPNTFSLDLGSIKSVDAYFKIDTEQLTLGVDYWNPKIEYQLAKKHQEGGLLYMQTDETEFLSLKSQVYAENITITPNDQIVITFKPNTSNEMNFTLYSNGDIVKVFTIVPSCNSDFSSQVMILEINSTIQFDQLMFSGTLNNKDHFSVNSISILEGASVIDTQLQTYDFVKDTYKPYIEIGTVDTSPNFANVHDNQYFNISSDLQSNMQQVIVEFEFNIEQSQIEDVNKIDIKLTGYAHSVSLGGALFKIKNFNNGLYETINYILKDNIYLFSISNDQFYKLINFDTYTVSFKIELSSSSDFQVHIDNLNAVTYKPWSVEHDLYRASFVFEPIGINQIGEVFVSVNERVNITINDNLLDFGDNVISFYYNLNEQQWHGYFYNNTYNDFIDLVDIADTEFSIPQLKIESHYSSFSEGIIVKSLESQYFTKFRDKQDFAKYKSLIASYKAVEAHADLIEFDTEDSLLTSENLFAQVSADIDIIYSFHDEMEHENIFEYELLPTFTANSYDSLESYIYDEAGFILDSSSDLSYSYVTDISEGAIDLGSLVNLQSDDDSDCVFKTDWSQKRDLDSGDLSVACGDETQYGCTGVGNIWSELDGTDWDIREDGVVRYYKVSRDVGGDDWLKASDEYYIPLGSFNPMYTPEDVDVEIKVKWDFSDTYPESEQPEFSHMKIYVMNWRTGQYVQFGSDIAASETTYTERTIDLSSDYWMDVVFPSTTLYRVKVKVETKAVAVNTGPFAQVYIDYLYVDIKRAGRDPNRSYVNFNEFDYTSLLNGQNDFYLYFIGKTNSFISDLYVDGSIEHTFDSTDYSSFSDFFTDIDSIKLFIVNDAEGLDGEAYDRRLLIDYLVLEWLNQPVNISIKNDKKINITSSFSHKQQTPIPIDSGLYDDPYFGRNSIHFTLKNTIQTPIFGRESDIIWADLELTDLDLDFKVYPDTNRPLENNNIEGNDESKYVPAILGNYSEYSTSRFRHSATCNIQMPLLSPIQLDFGQIDLTTYENGFLELALNLDVDLRNRASDSIWSLRSRLLYYNYTSGYWEDFKGTIWMESQGYNRAVWDPVTFSDNFIDYLQDFNVSNNIIPILNDNDVKVKNPFTINNLNNNTIKDGVMKLAFISYIIPSNISVDPNINKFTYDRLNPEIPIQISQTVEVLDCVFIGESRQIMYPEASITANLKLNENYRANLSLIDNVGEIIAVRGILVEDSITYEYPIEYYWITQDNELGFNSPMKYQFTNVSIDYIPQLLLTYNSSDGYWYLPESFVSGDINYTKPFFVSDLWVNDT